MRTNSLQALKTSSQMSADLERLSDWGEFRLIQDIVLPALAQVSEGAALGNDCVVLPTLDQHGDLVVTTDATPRPLAFNVGIEDYFIWGWYSVLVNASDLASTGCTPQAFCSSVEAPEDLSVASFKRFFQGVAEACAAFGFTNAGGNLRAARQFASHGTGIGYSKPGLSLSRTGCRPGDIIVAVGPCGQFISAYLKAKRLGIDMLGSSEQQCLTRPMAKVREMQLLNEHGLVRAASDNSDGLLGSVWSVAEASDCAIRLELAQGMLSRSTLAEAEAHQYDAWNLFFCWGDWQVLCAIDAMKWSSFQAFASAYGLGYLRLGVAEEGKPRIVASIDGVTRSANVVRNEAFLRTGYSQNSGTHLNHMLTTQIFGDAL